MQDLEELKQVASEGDIKGSVVLDLIARCESAEKLNENLTIIHSSSAGKIRELEAELKELREQKEVATVRVTNGGYVMILSTHVAYSLPEGTHKLYPDPVAQSRDSTEPVDRIMVSVNDALAIQVALLEAEVLARKTVKGQLLENLRNSWSLIESLITQSNANAHSEQVDAVAAFEQYVEKLGGLDSNAWHDAPADGLFIDGFNLGKQSQQSPAVPQAATKPDLYLYPDNEGFDCYGSMQKENVDGKGVAAWLSPTGVSPVSAEHNSNLPEAMEIVTCVAHIGVDFGFGEYHIEQSTIDKARKLVAQDEGKV